MSVTVTCQNHAPVADDERFAAERRAIGNTTLVVDAPGDAAAVVTGLHKTVTGDLLAGDADLDGPAPLAVVPGVHATDQGGSVTLQADGDFIYAPAPGTSCNHAVDGFAYTVSDGGDGGTDTGHVTISLARCVWYVDNSAAGNAGTSAEPFDGLGRAQAASHGGYTIFVRRGSRPTDPASP